MSRQPNGSGRYYVTLERGDADALEAAAEAQGRPPTTEAGLRIVQTLRSQGDEAAEELTRAGAELAEVRRQLEAARVENASMRRRLIGSNGDGHDNRPPRWAWPLEDLLGDRDWWAAWLPRLSETLGRPPLGGIGINGRQAREERGYVDLMAYLFPPVRIGAVAVEWHGIDYPVIVRRDARQDVGAGPTAADRWQPVIRHVAVALSALAQTETPGADPLLRIRTTDELTGPWLRTLRHLTGDETAALPGVGGAM